MAKKHKKLSDQLRDLIEEADCNRNQISLGTGVDPAVLCRFVAGQRGMSTDTLDAIGEFLDLVLVPRSQVKRRR